MNVKTVSYRNKDAARDFAESLRDTGFGVLTDHPVSHELIQGIFEDWARFFASEEKHSYLFNPELQSGYFPFRTENAKGAKQKDLKEFFHFYPNTTLPPVVERRTREAYRELLTLSAELLQWIEDYLPEEVRAQLSEPLTRMIHQSEESLLRPIHYPALRGDEEDGAIRAAAHEDINLITVLIAATAPGLQVQNSRGEWFEVKCDPGTLVINSGDMLKMATRGFYGSTTHRVINPAGPDSRKPRYSMPLFLHARKNVRLNERYTAGSYLEERLLEIGLLKK
jgi:isopenicillin N synthase-like dioxygenase